mmetsp:Transcript_35548/g.141765  ORF Transcript_35548/g.141765 Transcript_35548/m.141765 type:complete len:83 (-) Transcript_35548:87-335(-)
MVWSNSVELTGPGLVSKLCASQLTTGFLYCVGRDAPRKCRIRGCGKGFVTVEELNEHLRVEHGRAPIAPPKGHGSSNSSGYS